MLTENLWGSKVFLGVSLVVSSSVVLGQTVDICSRLPGTACSGVNAWIITGGAVSAAYFAVLSILWILMDNPFVVPGALELLGGIFFVCWWSAVVAVLSTITYNFNPLEQGFGFLSLFLTIAITVLASFAAAPEEKAKRFASEISD
ncbi:hypothetical protein FVE85_6258 [Porphyridium purpureum]|uniref:Uncharacterized protein n=1 Tax=Porphyridium purpureum TaxID=35688 RepID=A0A5J4Z776_PORPP|nr:hypothetical protein FVE85_6258 [Porphyridium purpureum]|eukprot:POR3061..scf295_1